MKQHNTPTESELEILQILWDEGAVSVRQVNDQLNKRRKTGYTTTLKLMQIMHEKGLVSRDTSQRSHIYSAVALEKETRSTLLDAFVDMAFSGSAQQLVMQVLGRHRPSAEELTAIKQLIDQLENE